MTRARLTVLAGLALCAAAGPARADSPYGKTFIGSAEVCSVNYGTCTGSLPIHVYLARTGHLFSFLRSEGGQEFSLGQFITFGTAQQRFIVSGNALVFEDAYPYNGQQVLLRGTLRAQGGACIMTASATMNGRPEPITFRGSCQVYEGQH